jgi:hypothetical protein
MDFLIAIVALGLVVWLFFLAVDRFAPDEFFKTVAKVAIGGIALIAVLFATKAVLFGGGGGMVVQPLGLLYFAAALLGAVVVLYLLYMAVDHLAPEPWRGSIKYVIGAVVLIALLLYAAEALFGAGRVLTGARPRAGAEPPFRVAGGAAAALPARSPADL